MPYVHEFLSERAQGSQTRIAPRDAAGVRGREEGACLAHRAARLASLGDVVATAVALNRTRAERQGVRLHAYVVDQPVPGLNEGALLERIDRVLGQVIAVAHWGSAITCEAGVTGGVMKLHVNYAHPVRPTADDPTGVAEIDEWWSWPIGGADRQSREEHAREPA